MSRPKKTAEPAVKVSKPEKIQAARGVHDFLPEDHAYFTLIKKVVRHRARQAGFRRISTPILEEKALFVRGVGGDTDIVEKELYALTTAGGSELALKPEGTAGVVRSFIQHGMGSLPQPVELYYIEPHFRHDRPQKGRFRQFHQFGFEVLGESDPAVDAQIIQIAQLIFQDLKIADRLSLQINTIGSLEDRAKYLEILKDYYAGKERNLCESCQKRLGTNPLRLLDCKSEDCQILAGMAPKLSAHISKEAKEHYEKVKELLKILDIKYTENGGLVRGLDYYAHTVFEFWDASTGAQNAVGGGGRYDGLVEQLGGTPTPACGFAGGIERVIAHMKEARLEVPDKDHVQIFVAQLGWEAKKEATKILTELREHGVHAMGALGTASMKAQLGKADKFGVDYALILGEVEVREGRAIIRDMAVGKQEILSLKDALPELLKKIGEDNLDFYDPSDDITETPRDPADELLIEDDEE
jgi:histidyl-tRNA synthetase